MQKNTKENYLLFSHSFDVHKEFARKGGNGSCASVVLNARIIAPSENPDIREFHV
jgi:hypothetical protein